MSRKGEGLLNSAIVELEQEAAAGSKNADADVCVDVAGETTAHLNVEAAASDAVAAQPSVDATEAPVLPSKPVYRFWKRMFDILFSFLFGVLLLLPMGVIALIICLDSEGGAIFRQKRLGLNGKEFTLYKFRSMDIHAEDNGPCLAEEDDPRCTRPGRFLRKTRLDELPQLWNIFVGDMSFVGPRPERPEFYDKYDTTVPGFRHRLLVVPGLTGRAQVIGGYSQAAADKLMLDMEYIRERSLLRDAGYILRTVGVVFTGKGAR